MNSDKTPECPEWVRRLFSEIFLKFQKIMGKSKLSQNQMILKFFGNSGEK